MYAGEQKGVGDDQSAQYIPLGMSYFWLYTYVLKTVVEVGKIYSIKMDNFNNFTLTHSKDKSQLVPKLFVTSVCLIF